MCTDSRRNWKNRLNLKSSDLINGLRRQKKSFDFSALKNQLLRVQKF